MQSDLSQETIQALREIIRDEITAEHRCRLNMSDEDARALVEYTHMLSIVGDGSIARGVDVIRDNHRWLRTQRERGSWLSAAILGVIITGVVGGLLSAVWLGLKALLGSAVRG